MKRGSNSAVSVGDDGGSKLSFNAMGRCFGLRRRRQFGEGSEESGEKISAVA